MLTMMRHAVCLGMVLAALMLEPGFAAGATSAVPEPEGDSDGVTFKLNVVQRQYLPPAMYGTWSIAATPLSSDVPLDLYAPLVYELWTLIKENDQIILKNIVNNASAAIEVDKVEGNTATFHHETSDTFIKTRNLKIRETPTITVEGDRLSGINRQEITSYRKGKPYKTYHLDIKVEGTRISGAKVTFGNPDPVTPQFEVAPIEFRN